MVVDHWYPCLQVTDNMCAAMLHYYLPAVPEVAFGSFLKWFHSFHNLFAAPCKQCGKLLQNGLPPTWRDNRALLGFPFHESCKP